MATTKEAGRMLSNDWLEFRPVVGTMTNEDGKVRRVVRMNQVWKHGTERRVCTNCYRTDLYCNC